MFFRYLKNGLLYGAAYGLGFLLLEDFIGWSLGAKFTLRQFFYTVVLYVGLFAAVGIAVALWYYLITPKSKRVQRPLQGHILLLCVGFALFMLGLKSLIHPVFHTVVSRLIPLAVGWALFIYIAQWLMMRLMKMGGGKRRQILLSRAVALSVMLTIVLLIIYKTLYDLNVLTEFNKTVPWWPVLGLMAGAGGFLLAMAVGKTVYSRRAKTESSKGIIPRIAAGTALVLISYLGWQIPLASRELPAFPPDKARTAADPPNIILLVIDTLRADHMSLYGYSRRTTPVLDEYASRGVVFENAYALSSWTKPSMGSLNTSRYNEMNRVVKWTDLYSDELVMLPELLSEAGYYTGLISSNQFVTPEYNFSQGIDDFTYALGEGFKQLLFPGDLLSLRYPILIEWAFRMELINSETVNANAATMNEYVLPWLERNCASRFFLQLHYMDPHVPYLPPERNYSRGLKLYMSDFRFMKRLHDSSDTLEVRPERVNKIVSRYDDEIAFTDRQLGEFFRTFNSLNLWENTLLIITSDHGEEFTEHGFGGHGHSLFNELIHVPLILFFPGGEYSGMRIDEPVTLLDVMPTILDYVKVESNSPMEGASLLPVLQGDMDALPQACRLYYGSVCPVEEDWAFHRIRAVSDYEYKYIRGYYNDFGDYHEFLFDMIKDPLERNNLLDSTPDVHQSLSSKMDDFIAYCDSAAMLIEQSERIEISEKERERLKALGYIK